MCLLICFLPVYSILFVYSYNLFMCKYHACMLYGFFCYKGLKNLATTCFAPKDFFSDPDRSCMCKEYGCILHEKKSQDFFFFHTENKTGAKPSPARVHVHWIGLSLSLSLSEAALDHHAA